MALMWTPGIETVSEQAFDELSIILQYRSIFDKEPCHAWVPVTDTCCCVYCSVRDRFVVCEGWFWESCVFRVDRILCSLRRGGHVAAAQVGKNQLSPGTMQRHDFYKPNSSDITLETCSADVQLVQRPSTVRLEAWGFGFWKGSCYCPAGALEKAKKQAWNQSIVVKWGLFSVHMVLLVLRNEPGLLRHGLKLSLHA
jgi:hypothetical protein